MTLDGTIVRDDNGNPLRGITSGHISRIELPASFVSRLGPDKIFTHNHGYPPTTPSLADLLFAQEHNLGELRAVGMVSRSDFLGRTQTNDKLFQYSLRPGKAGWPSEDALIAAYESVGGIPKEVPRDFGHRRWQSIAKRLGLRYSRTIAEGKWA